MSKKTSLSIMAAMWVLSLCSGGDEVKINRKRPLVVTDNRNEESKKHLRIIPPFSNNSSLSSDSISSRESNSSLFAQSDCVQSDTPPPPPHNLLSSIKTLPTDPTTLSIEERQILFAMFATANDVWKP